MIKKLCAMGLALLSALSLLCACSSKSPAVMTVGAVEITAQEYNYTYHSQVQEFYASYSSYLSYFGLDPEKPLKDQPCSFLEDGGSWADFFMKQTEELLRQVYCFYNAALAKGMTLEESYTLQLDAFLLSALETAQKQNKTLDEYLSEYYGAGLTEENYREFLSHRLLATQYCDREIASIVYSDEEYEAYYQKNRAAIDKLNFRIFTITEDHLPADTSADDEASVEAAVKQYAELFAKDLTTEEEFCQRALAYALNSEKDNYRSPSATLAKNVSASDLADSDMKTWLFDDARVKGDVSVHKTSTATYTVCFYLSKGRDESPLASMRHILLKVDETKEGLTDSEVKAAIEGIYDQWKGEGMTEESFIALASAHTEDPGSKDTGGLYENFARGTMVSEIDEWLYASGRQRGDSTVVKTVHGYHIVWFTGYGDLGWKAECLPGLQDADYYELLESLSQTYPVSFAENYREQLGNE